MTDTQDRLEERLSEPGTKAGKALYDAMRESAAGLPERLAGKWPYRDAILAIEEEAALRQSQDMEAAAREVDEVRAEVLRAEAKFAPFNSPHEGWAVIREELDELWEHVRANTGRTPEARQEALQVAAMAVRYMRDLAALAPKAEEAPHE